MIVGILVGAGVLTYLGSTADTILIQSEESKTLEDGPVFNRIRFFTNATQDIWMMQQSHHGLAFDSNQWDRLAIVIDKTRSPKIARFIQLKPGPLEWESNSLNQSIRFRVSCFLCHVNGPRVIRPNVHSTDQATESRLSFLERLKIFAWNLRIKTYGRIEVDPLQLQEDTHLKTPFRLKGKLENEILSLKPCLYCHQEKGWFARGALTRQNFLTIRFMVSKGYMPPLGFSMSKKESAQLEDFLNGF